MTRAGQNLVLIGLMGAGKSSIGRLVADALGRRLVDTDAAVEADAQASIAELFAREGEDSFRAREAEAIKAAAARTGRVIAVGGGAVSDPINAQRLRATGTVIFLDAAPAVLAQRLNVDGVAERPLLAGSGELAERLSALRGERLTAYEDAAHHTVETTALTQAQAADAVLEKAGVAPGPRQDPGARAAVRGQL